MCLLKSNINYLIVCLYECQFEYCLVLGNKISKVVNGAFLSKLYEMVRKTAQEWVVKNFIFIFTLSFLLKPRINAATNKV